MSIADSVRGLSEEATADFLRNRKLPQTILVPMFPPMSRQGEWIKRRFMESKRAERQQDALEDVMWFIPDLPGGEW